MRLEGRTAIITGSGGGIGRAGARLFAREGAAIVIAEYNEAIGRPTADEIVQAGGKAIFVQTDVRSSDSIAAMVRATVDAFGPPNILYNNAGIEVPEAEDGPSEDDWDRMFDTNVKGTWLCTKAVLPYLLDAGSGVILNTASITGLIGIAARVGYSASKAAVANFTRSLALTYAERGIRVNAMAPGRVMTQASIDEWAQAPDPEVGRRRTLSTTPINRVAQPEEIANLALFLVSDEASYITGAVIPIDGAKTSGLMLFERYRG